MVEDPVGLLMKLYAWQPRGHGEQSVFVMALSLDEAKRAADEAIKAATDYTDPKREDRDWNYCDADFDGWGSDYYELTVHEPGAVLFHEND